MRFTLIEETKRKQSKWNKVQATLDICNETSALSTPSDFSEYTVTNFPGYETQQ